MATLKKTDPGTPRYYKSIFIAAFLLAEFLILIIQQAYLVMADESVSRTLLVWNVLLTSGVVLIVLLSTYFVVKLLLARQAVSEAKFRELAEQLPDPVFETDPDGKITFVNRAATDTFGYSKGQMSEMSVLELLAEHEKEKVAVQPVNINVVGKREYTARRSDGSEFPMLVDSSLIIEEDEPVGLRGVVIEITDLKRMEDELRRANAELRAYAHVVSHDLKNPLTVIRTSSEVLERVLRAVPEGQDKSVRELLELQHRGLDRSERIINDLLAFAETRDMPEVEPVDISGVVEDIMAERSSLIEERHASVRGEDLGTVVASPIHMYQLFSNLMVNTLMHNEREPLTIEITHFMEDGKHRYLYRDNGSGIPEDILHDVFVPFVKDNRTGDTGIGLSIVEKIVEIYDGSIKAYNNNGACFDFTLKDAPREE